MKNKEIQIFTTSNIVFLLLLLTLCIAIIIPLVARTKSKETKLVYGKAESLAYQVMQIEKSPSRGPASEISLQKDGLGEIGIDPWGKPYYFKIMKTSADSNTKIAVWSSGPNQNNDSVLSENGTVTQFTGDDIGVIISSIK